MVKINRRAKQQRRINYQKYNHLYKLFCPHKDLRFICFYCGLPAGTVDHVPALNKVEELRAVYDIQHYTKVPCCSECNSVAGDEPHLEIFERRKFLKDKLKKRYKKYIKLPDWEEDEIKELGYTSKVMVEAAMSIKYLVAYRLTYGDERNIKASDLGYLQYDPRKLFKYAKAENWDKTIKAVDDKELSLREVNARFKEIAKKRLEADAKETQKSDKFPFIEARSFVRKLGIKNTKDWIRWRKENIGLYEREKLPPHPASYYKDAWKGWKDFLGKSYLNQNLEKVRSQKLLESNYPDYKQAKKLIQKNKSVRNSSTYAAFQRENKDKFPTNPQKFYKDWKGWQDFLGENYFSKNIQKKIDYLPFSSAKKLIAGKKFTKAGDYFQNYKKLSNKLPHAPHKIYLDDWKGWNNFLGSNYYKEWFPYEKLSELMKVNKIKNRSHYAKFRKNSKDKVHMPSHPDKSYKEHWKGWNDFLGKEKRVE